MVHDIATMKRLGFTMLRKHLKVEPLRWYAHCDRLGMLVWQDFVNGGGRYRTAAVTWPGRWPVRLRDRPLRPAGSRRPGRAAASSARSCGRTVELLRSVTSLAVWVPFNEGWGQFDAADVAARAGRARPDPQRRPRERLARPGRAATCGACTSTSAGSGAPARPRRASACWCCREYGGYDLAVPGHTWGPEHFGYRHFELRERARRGVRARCTTRRSPPPYAGGLAATVYTQLSDVEDEVNGLLTYDREVLKLPAELVRRTVAGLYAGTRPGHAVGPARGIGERHPAVGAPCSSGRRARRAGPPRRPRRPHATSRCRSRRAVRRRGAAAGPGGPAHRAARGGGTRRRGPGRSAPTRSGRPRSWHSASHWPGGMSRQTWSTALRPPGQEAARHPRRAACRDHAERHPARRPADDVAEVRIARGRPQVLGARGQRRHVVGVQVEVQAAGRGLQHPLGLQVAGRRHRGDSWRTPPWRRGARTAGRRSPGSRRPQPPRPTPRPCPGTRSATGPPGSSPRRPCVSRGADGHAVVATATSSGQLAVRGVIGRPVQHGMARCHVRSGLGRLRVPVEDEGVAALLHRRPDQRDVRARHQVGPGAGPKALDDEDAAVERRGDRDRLRPAGCRPR